MVRLVMQRTLPNVGLSFRPSVARAGIQRLLIVVNGWIPAFAGMTSLSAR
jgi:hypothetical protein